MPPFLFFTALVLAAILVSSLTAQPLYEISKAATLTDFDNFAKRLGMLLILIAIVVSLKLKGWWHKEAVGWARHPSYKERTLLSGGFVVGVLLMLPITLLFHLLEIRLLDTSLLWSRILTNIASILLAAFLVSLIEETFFRGILFHGFLARQQAVSAVVFSALFFCVLHFARLKDTPLPSDASWYYGLTALLESAAGYSQLTYLSTALSLFLAGVLLGLLRLWSGSVVACIGVHAGWIFSIKIDKKLSAFNADAPAAFWVGAYDSYNGWATAIWLLLLTTWACYKISRKSVNAS